MKIFKSIKWRLQIWYGLILLAVLIGLGFFAYQLQRAKMYRQVDNELQHRINAVAQALRRPGQQPERRPPPQNDFDQPPGPPGDNFGGNRPPMSPGDFHLRQRDEALFDAGATNAFYYVVVGRDGKEIARSTNAPFNEVYAYESGTVAGKLNHIAPFPRWRDDRQKYNGEQFVFENFPTNGVPVGQPFPPYMRGTFREVMIDLPSREQILVGRNMVVELAELRMVAFQLAGVSGIILLIGLAGGWWLTTRSLKPVSEISATAVKISAGDLSQRINVDEAESELGQLAAVLNSTFARLETAFAQQKQFAADAAHELRTPVSVILTQTQTALARERDAGSYKQTVEACQRAAQRMRKLIESLLELARFDAGQEVLKQLRFNFSKTISDSVELVQTLAEERNVKIISEIASLEIIGDSERLAQVVTNLLTNAIQYNQPGGEVRLKLESQNGLAVLEIADTGQGIAPEDLPRVFERFYRADQSRTGAGNAGLGLSICKAIIEAHGGTIEVASESNVGTTFTVRLPIKLT